MATITLSIASTPVTVSKTYNGADADVQNILDWAAANYATWIAAQFNPSNASGFVPTNAEIAAAIAYDFISHITVAVQAFKTTPPVMPVVPPPMSWT
jgi:hypothetical protein